MGGSFTRFMFSFSSSEPARVCMLGLDCAGKSTVINHLKLGKATHTLPTIGFNVETVTPFRGLTLTIWDVGGQDTLRPLWKHYYRSTQGLIYVVDCTDVARFVQASSELHNILDDLNIKRVPLVVFANKQDISGAVNGKELEEILHLHDRHPDQLWYIQECCAIKGDGIYEGLKKLSQFMKTSRKTSKSEEKSTAIKRRHTTKI